MLCLLPFPYTPKPNEQHGTRPLAFTPSSPLLLQSVSSYVRLLPSRLHRLSMLWPISSVLRIFLLAPPSLPPSVLPSVHLSDCASMEPMHSMHVSALPATTSPLRDRRPVTWHGLRRLRSELSLSQGNALSHRDRWGPHKGTLTDTTTTYVRACAHPPVQAHTAFHILLIRDWLIYILQ